MSVPMSSPSARSATLTGPSSRRGRPLITADLLRLLGLSLIPAAWLVAGWPSAAAMFLVFGAQWLLRWLAGGGLLDWGGQAVLLAAGWSSVIGLYHRAEGLDLVMHAAVTAVVTGLVAVVVRSVLRRRGRSRGPVPPHEAVRVLGPVVSALALTSAGVALGVVWEIAEWWGHHQVAEEIGVGYDDTLGDLTADLVGALVAALVAVRSVRTRTTASPGYSAPGDAR